VFDFLGFTHYCTRSRKWGSFVIGRKTIKKRMLRTLGAIKVELRKRMHDPIVKTGATARRRFCLPKWVRRRDLNHRTLRAALRLWLQCLTRSR
jgi:hypothetical protein